MTAVLQTLTLVQCLCVALALPTNPEGPALLELDPDNIANRNNITALTPPTDSSVHCLKKHNPPPLIPSECRFILDTIILQQPNVNQPREFQDKQYKIDNGRYARSLWQHGSCEVSVFGKRHASQFLSLLEVALAADDIVHDCLDGLVKPIGGLKFIGDVSKGFHVILQGHDDRVVSATNSSVSQPPSVRVSKRVMRSAPNPERSAESQVVETRDSPTELSLVPIQPAGAPNSTSSVAAAWNHPVHCLDPRTAPLEGPEPRDCNHIANQIIYRLFDPWVQRTFGFTDAAEINLSRPEYQEWRYGQCVVSLRNDDETQSDTFKFQDVVVTALRINGKCVLDRWESPIGGTANVGTLGHGFYVYLSVPEDSGSVSSDVTFS